MPLKDFGALTVGSDGAITKYDEGCFPYGVDAPWSSEGAHEEFVMGLLVGGASAPEAVAMAIQHCVWGGGKVIEFRPKD